jgi:tetratricopeptide (TPR) repeat protein
MRCFRKQAAMLVVAACLVGGLFSSAFSQTAPAQSVSAQSVSASTNALVDALRKGQNADALRISAKLLRTNPRSFKIWTLRATALDQLGRSEEALSVYQRALKLAPDYLPALEGAAQLGYKRQSAQAVLLLRHILFLLPANPTAHAMLGVLEYRQGSYGLAAEDFAAAGPALESQPSALMAYSICLAHLSRASEAMAHFQQLLALRPADATVRYDLALLQWHSGSGSDALAMLQPALDAGTANSGILRLAAAIHEANNETPQAVELLRAAIIRNPGEEASYVDFATLSFTHGSYAVGIDIVNLGLTKLPDSAALYMARGVLYGQNGDFDKAMSDFELAHKLDPGYSLTATAEGIAQSQRHHHEEALENFRRQVREHPKDAFGYYLLAEALSWSPSDAKQESSQKSFSEAISAAKTSIDLDPHLAQAYDLLASLYLQTDQPEQAVQICRAVLRMTPKDQQAVYNLMLALRKTGAKEELKGLVQKLTELRKEEQAENNRTNRYGQLVEAP